MDIRYTGCPRSLSEAAPRYEYNDILAEGLRFEALGALRGTYRSYVYPAARAYMYRASFSL